VIAAGPGTAGWSRSSARPAGCQCRRPWRGAAATPAARRPGPRRGRPAPGSRSRPGAAAQPRTCPSGPRPPPFHLCWSPHRRPSRVQRDVRGLRIDDRVRRQDELDAGAASDLRRREHGRSCHPVGARRRRPCGSSPGAQRVPGSAWPTPQTICSPPQARGKCSNCRGQRSTRWASD
jgi:hypothetical protein